MSAAGIVFVHDFERPQLELSLGLLHRHLPADGRFVVRGYQSRNALLDEIAALDGRAPALALVDLQVDARLDGNYAGHRLIATIRHHPRLATRCRPLAFTIHDREDVVAFVQTAGAYGLVRKRDLERTVSAPAELDLATAFEGILRLPAQHIDSPSTPFVTLPDVPQPAKEADTMMTVRRFLDLPAKSQPLNERDWQVLRLLADGVDRESIEAWVAADTNYTVKTVSNRIDDLSRWAAPAYRGSRTDLRRLALDLLQAVPAARRPPAPEVPARLLPPLDLGVELLADPQVSTAAWLDEEAKAALRDVSEVAPGGRRARASQQADDIAAAIAALEPTDDAARRRKERALARALTALVDADADLRTFPRG